MKALIAMSGGVDSSVAALIMIEHGYECAGCTMRLFSNDDAGYCDDCYGQTCCSLDDVEDARNVAFGLGMRHYTFNMMDGFRRNVIKRFIEGYEHGTTPNPCIDCNRYMKFSLLYDKAKMLGYDKIVTGHYAQITCKNGVYRLLKGKDPKKDQSYVLYNLTQEQLAHTEFPLGAYDKEEVRALAQKHGFVNAKKAESQDICFVPDGDYAAAIKRMTGKEYPEGDFVDCTGKVLGQHKGIINYTVGQRKGLGVAVGHPLYVCRIDAEENRVVLGTVEDTRFSELLLEDVNWILGQPSLAGMQCKVRTHYHQQEQPAMVYPVGDMGARVVFENPHGGAAPGQAAVFYDDEVVLGGGTIRETRC